MTDQEVDLDAEPGTQAYTPVYSDVRPSKYASTFLSADLSIEGASRGGLPSEGKRSEP